MATESGIQAAAVEIGVGADTSQAEGAVDQLASDIQGKTDRAAKSATASIQNFSSRSGNTVTSFRQQLSSLNMALGGSSPLGPLVAGLSGLEGGLRRIDPAERTAQTSLERLSGTSSLIMALSTAILGVAGALTKVSAPAQQSQAALKTAVDNTGKSLDDQFDKTRTLGQAMADARNQAANYGYSQDQVNTALAKLTVQTKSPVEALKELKETETLAAASGRDLSRAADMIGRMHAGQYRYLRQFGIDIQNVGNTEKEAASAAKALATAQENLTAAQQKLTQMTQRNEAAMAAAKEKADQKVADSQAKLSDAQQHYDALVQEQTARETTDAQTYADAVTKANQDIVDAQQHLADVQADQSARRLDELEQQKEAEESAMNAVRDANRTVADLMHMNSLRPQTTAAGQEQYEQQLRDAKLRSVDAQEKLNDVQTKSLESNSQQVNDAQALRDAQEQLTKAQTAQIKANNDQAKSQASIIAGQETLRRAAETLQHAQEGLTKAQQADVAAGHLTLAQQQAQSNLEQTIAKDKDKVAAAQDRVNKAQAGQNALDETFRKAMEQFMSREKGLLENREHTWAGHWAKLKAQVTNFVQDFGSTMAPVLTGAATVGFALSGLGKLGAGIGKVVGGMRGRGAGGVGAEAESAISDIGAAWPGASVGRGAGGKFTSLGKDAEEAEKMIGGAKRGILGHVKDIFGALKSRGAMSGEGGFMNLAGVGGKVAGAFGSAKTAVIESITGMLPMLGELGATLLAFAAPIAIVAGIGLVAYEIYKHWDQVSGALSKTWHFIQNMAKTIFNDVTKFFRKWGLDIIEVLTGTWMIVQIAKHWGQIEDTIKAWGPRVLEFLGHWGLDAILVLTGAWMIVEVVKHWQGIKDGIFGVFGGAIKWLTNAGADVIRGLYNGVVDGGKDFWNFWSNLPGNVWDKLKGMWDVAGDMVNAGKNILIGLINGLESGVGKVWDWVRGFAGDFIHKITHPWELLSPSKRMHRIGQDLMRGLNNGLEAQKNQVFGKITEISNGLGVRARMKVALTAGTPGLPGNIMGVAGARTGQSVVVLNLQQHVAGSVVTEKELMNKARNFIVTGGQRSGGVANFLGVKG